ncbi:MAG TPA: HlyD family efflux transporter periplasmic adaptor subunit [Pseudomonadales bacterium]|nr:HlyD family efflux transporter periplasmic adaptor subunit [Pseudomonadales bacterium]
MSQPVHNVLATVLGLINRASQAEDLAELRFMLVNETRQMLPYRLAMLWLENEGVSALSGVVSIEKNAPFVLWLNRLFSHLQGLGFDSGSRVLTRADLPDDIANEYAQWLASDTLLVPMPVIEGCFSGGFLLLSRDGAWQEQEQLLLKQWTDAWPLAYSAKDRRLSWQRVGYALEQRFGKVLSASWRREFLTNRKTLAVAVMVLALLFWPVHLSVLAPASIVPLHPTIVRAPLDGIIKSIDIEPNANVLGGEVLFTFDDIALNNKFVITQQELQSLQTEYRQISQMSLLETDMRGKLMLLRGQMDVKQKEIAYLEEMLARSQVKAERAGVVLLGDPLEWIGRPVMTGERVMAIADPEQMEIEAWLSPADAIALPQGADVKLYLNADPLTSINATVRYVAHEAVPRPDGTFAYRVRATLQEIPEIARIGLRGTAKLNGDTVALGYWMIRRPWAALRTWLGW